MSWSEPGLLWLLPAACLWVGAAHWLRERRRRLVLEALRAPWEAGGERLRTGLVMGALSLIVVALSGPGVTVAESTTPMEGADVVLLMDVSRSMSTRDVVPDRGRVARLAALRIATGVESGRVGVAAFAADAYLMVPPTTDQGLVTLYVESLDPDAVTGQGSDLARALDVAVSAVDGGSVVLVSDGEGFQDEAALEESLRAARDASVVVHTVVAGTPRGGDVPGVLTGAHSSARPDILAKIARSTGGLSVDAGDGPALARLAATLAGSRKPLPREGAGGRFVPVAALAALSLLLLESTLAARRRPGAP